MRTRFDWDQWNVQKSYLKHGITNYEAESVFDDMHRINYHDDVHSVEEDRYICIGKSSFSRVLFIAYTIRGNKYRVISARIANRKERTYYGS